MSRVEARDQEKPSQLSLFIPERDIELLIDTYWLFRQVGLGDFPYLRKSSEDPNGRPFKTDETVVEFVISKAPNSLASLDNFLEFVSFQLELKRRTIDEKERRSLIQFSARDLAMKLETLREPTVDVPNLTLGDS